MGMTDMMNKSLMALCYPLRIYAIDYRDNKADTSCYSGWRMITCKCAKNTDHAKIKMPFECALHSAVLVSCAKRLKSFMSVQ